MWYIWILFVATVGVNIAPLAGQQIHANLVQCYRGNGTQPWIGNTLQLLIELVRKIEDANPTSLDIRLLSVNIMHRLRIDGIERAPSILETEFVTPYRPNGIMSPKYRLLLQLISDTPGSVNFSEYLTTAELCQLHRMVSASVEPYERGDEARTCPLTMMSVDRVESPWIKWNKVQDPFSRGTIVSSGRVSRCPLEMGVVRSRDYGSFTPGTFIASIAAGLQPQNVRINEFVEIAYKRTEYENLETMERRDTEKSVNKLLRSLDSIDNTYSAGLAGDLAEVCVFQGPYVGANSTIGLAGMWNNTNFPRTRFLTENHGARWEFTDAEILAGIDGLFVSQQISSWVQKVRRIRLSQVLDMYYSARGIPSMAIETVGRGKHVRRRPNENLYQSSTTKPSHRDIEDIVELTADDDVRTFNRKSSAREVFDNNDRELPTETSKHLERFSVNDGISSACDRAQVLQLIDRDKLKDETYFLSQVLQFTTSSMAVNDETLRTNCDAAVDRFFEYASTLLDALPTCNSILADFHQRPLIDMTLVIDGSRNQYENLEFISHIVESVDVSNSGSFISVIHGTSARYMVNRTNSVSTAFQQLHNFTDPYPTGLSLSRSLQRFLHTLARQTRNEQSSGIIAAKSHVILVASQSQRIDQVDFASASRMIHGSLHQFPDLYFVFLTNDAESFNELIRNTQTPFEALRRQEHYKIIATDNIEPSAFTNELVRHLKTIPKRIMAPFCRNVSVQWRRTVDETNLSYYFEDYASPTEELRYRISPAYLKNSDNVHIIFQVNYGEVTVCMSRDTEYAPIQCFTIDETKTADFHIGNPCENILECPGIYFAVQMERSDMRCSENDCRYPDQTRLIIRHSGLRCEHDTRSNSISLNASWTCILMIVMLATLKSLA